LRVRDLLREAARWRLLGRLFECPSDDWRRDLAVLAREVEDADLRRAAEAAFDGAAEGRYHSVFGPGGPAPPREASYHDTLELGSLMSELTMSYTAFGYRASIHEPPDHVAVELGFLSYLRLKEAYALFGGESEHAAVAAEAAERFRADHLAMLAAPLAAVLAESRIDYLVRASAVLESRVGPRPERARLRVIQPSG
jgi:nitrate reductase assembly molybdenum cofactor insertion protein NarJ